MKSVEKVMNFLTSGSSESSLTQYVAEGRKERAWNINAYKQMYELQETLPLFFFYPPFFRCCSFPNNIERCCKLSDQMNKYPVCLNIFHRRTETKKFFQMKYVEQNIVPSRCNKQSNNEAAQQS